MVTKKPIAKIGRRKSPETLERERIEAILKNPPPYLKANAQLRDQSLQLLERLDGLEQEILQRHASSIPRKLIYQIESIDDELLSEHKEIILKKYSDAQSRTIGGGLNGARKTASKAGERAHNVWDKNIRLVRRIESGNLTLNGAANIIIAEWSSRGDGGKQPCAQTVKNRLTKLQKAPP